MIKQKIANFWLYKQRYRLAYGFLILSFISILAFAIFVAPNGLTQDEISSTVASHNLEFSNIFSKEIVNLPFKILQKISISIFGLSEFSIKLPAILLSILAIFLIVKLSHAWFGRGIATIAAVLATASGQFFFISQSGTADILQIIYPAALILLGFEFIRKRSKIALWGISAILGLSLYSPLGIFMIVAGGLLLFSHPGLRLTFKRLPKNEKLIAGGIFLVAILPILVAIFRDFSTIGALTGIPEGINLSANFKEVTTRLFSFSSKFQSGVISPILSLPTLILVAIGIFFTLSFRHTPKSYLLYIWTSILLISCLINPNATTMLFIPILLLTTTGIYSLIQTWYTIFPKNPYARVFGLIPISVFILGFLIGNIDNFRLNYLYSPEVGAKFNQDLDLILPELKNQPEAIISKTEKPLFQILSSQEKLKIVETPTAQEVIISKKSFENLGKIPENYQLSKIVTSSRATDADRFYILKKR